MHCPSNRDVLLQFPDGRLLRQGVIENGLVAENHRQTLERVAGMMSFQIIAICNRMTMSLITWIITMTICMFGERERALHSILQCIHKPIYFTHRNILISGEGPTCGTVQIQIIPAWLALWTLNLARSPGWRPRSHCTIWTFPKLRASTFIHTSILDFRLQTVQFGLPPLLISMEAFLL